MILFLKAHVDGHLRGSTYVRPYERQAPAVMSFRSGASAPSIAHGYIGVRVPFGVSIREMGAGSSTWPMMFDYARRGGDVFVDTGAFSDHMKGEPTDWPRVLAAYRRIIQEGQGGRLHVVAPDVIGNQAASLAILAQHRNIVLDMMAAGHDVLVPIQKGPMTPYRAWREAVRILGTDDFTASVPSNAAAFTPQDLAALFDGPEKPRRVHLLGIAGRKKRLDELARIIHSRSPETIITSDANRLRAQVGQGRPVTEERKRIRGHFDAALRSAALPDDPPEMVADAPPIVQQMARIVAFLRDPMEDRVYRLQNLDRLYARPIQSGAIQNVERRELAREQAGVPQKDLFGGAS